jgi:tight adherence protein C
MTAADFYILNSILRITIPLLFTAYAVLAGLNITGVLLLTFLGFLLSFKALDFYINSKIKNRYRKALRELPDFLDLLTISVEAGLGFDSALNKIIAKKDGILSTEFFIYLEEMRLGRTRKEALEGIKNRLDFDDMKSFINSIIQAEKLGTGIVQTLRTKSEDERDKRKQRAEEQAMKTSIKILFPLIFFIFPSIFIVVFGPAAIQLLNAFSKVK